MKLRMYLYDSQNPMPPDRVENTRSCGRVRQTRLLCNLGEIIDASVNGMRIRSSSRPSKKNTFEITLAEFALSGPLYGRRVWSKRIGWFEHEIGIEFVDTDAEVLREFTSIACAGLPAPAFIEPMPEAA